MKITKSQLKRIIQEETEKLQKEGFMDWFKSEPEKRSGEEADIIEMYDTKERELQPVFDEWERKIDEYNERINYWEKRLGEWPDCYGSHDRDGCKAAKKRTRQAQKFFDWAKVQTPWYKIIKQLSPEVDTAGQGLGYWPSRKNVERIYRGFQLGSIHSELKEKIENATPEGISEEIIRVLRRESRKQKEEAKAAGVMISLPFATLADTPEGFGVTDEGDLYIPHLSDERLREITSDLRSSNADYAKGSSQKAEEWEREQRRNPKPVEYGEEYETTEPTEGGGDVRFTKHRRVITPKNPYLEENSVTKKSLKRMIQQEMKKSKRKK
jgi:hypothetical protein